MNLTTTLNALILSFALTLSTTACGDLIGGSCTAIGCLDGLSVGLTYNDGATLADGDYTLTATDDANSASRTCEVVVASGNITQASGGCNMLRNDGTVTFESFVPTAVTLTLSDSSGTLATNTRSVTYDESRPNGDDCDPVCFTKTESFEVGQ